MYALIDLLLMLVLVQLLEIHVDQSPDGESADLVRARDLLGVSLCNRSVCNLLVGNAYNGKVSVVVVVCLVEAFCLDWRRRCT